MVVRLLMLNGSILTPGCLTQMGKIRAKNALPHALNDQARHTIASVPEGAGSA